jgi:hypothetical protein
VKENYIVAVFLEQQEAVLASSFLQQVPDFAHFFFFLLPPMFSDAITTPVIKNAAATNANTFFMLINF